ncbi:hypothetical protein [Flaviaesturariibacter terrae]
MNPKRSLHPQLFTAVLFLCLLTVLSSCLRTDTYDIPATGGSNPGTGTGTRLTGIYVLDSTLPPGLDTAYLQRYTYDGNGRILIVLGTDKQPGGDSAHYQYFYSGNDTLADRIISYERITGFGTQEYFDTLYLKYAAGKLVCDSLVRGPGAGTPAFSQWTRYIYLSNGIFSYRTDDFTPNTNDTAILGYLHTVASSNGSITSARDDSAFYNSRTGAVRVMNRYSDFSATYDMRANPSFQIGRAYQIPFADIEYFVELPTDGTISSRLPVTTQQTSNVYPGGIVKTSNTYVFGANGMPVSRSMRIFDQNGWGDWETVHFVYQ